MPELYSAKKPTSSESKKKENPKFPEKAPFDESLRQAFHTHNPLASFSYQPEGIKFETQEEEETVVLLLRQHPIVNIPWIIVTVILVFAPSILSVFPLLDFLPLRFQFIAILFWYLITAAYVLESALSWFFNVYIVTNERIIDVDFENLLYREVSEANIEKIQDIEYQIGGVSRSIFNYGDVFIQTAGTIQNFDFKAVPNPADVVRIIQNLKEAEEKEHARGAL
jgi:uncharacterized membrane protein YdbT with pleckstrin-like domain